MEFKNQKMPSGAKNPNAKMIYIRDENLLADRELKNRSGFYNWCVSQSKLREYFNINIVAK